MRINEFLSIIVVYIILLFSVFDAHITQLLGWSSFVGIELILLGLLCLIICIILYRKRISAIEIYAFILLGGSFLTSSLINFQIFTSFLGVLFLFKVFLFFIVGKHLIIRDSITRSIFLNIVLIAVLSGIVSFIQVFYSFNPFGFFQIGGKVIGILENANKNAIFLLVGFVISNFYLIRSKWLKVLSAGFFISAIIISSSRQVVFILFIILMLYYIFFMKRYFTAVFLTIFSIIVFIVFQNTLFQRFSEYDRIVSTGNYFRLKSLIISSEVIVDYPIFGVGAGFWGGKIAQTFDSKYHTKYKLFEHWKNAKQKPVTIDMYWPHAFVELGIIWFIFFIGLLFKILLYFKNHKHKINITLFLLLAITLLSSFLSLSMTAPSICVCVFLFAGMLYNNINSRKYE